MKTAIFSLARASFVAMAVSVAPAADLAGRYEKNYTATDNSGCSCDAPGVTGLVCATPYRCREMAGVCVGDCANTVWDDAGCSCELRDLSTVLRNPSQLQGNERPVHGRLLTGSADRG